MAVKLDERFWSKVNKNAPNGCWEWTASKTRDGYGQFRLDGRLQYAHRVSWETANGPIPEGVFNDHMCWNRGCVRPEHLRLATRAENMQNYSGAYRSSKSGVRGVSWHRQHRKWRASAMLGGKRYHLGYYEDIADAERVVTEWRHENMPNSLKDQIARAA